MIAVGASLSNHTSHAGQLYPKASVVHIDSNPLGLSYGLPTADVSLPNDGLIALYRKEPSVATQNRP